MIYHNVTPNIGFDYLMVIVHINKVNDHYREMAWLPFQKTGLMAPFNKRHKIVGTKIIQQQNKVIESIKS